MSKLSQKIQAMNVIRVSKQMLKRLVSKKGNEKYCKDQLKVSIVQGKCV